MRGWMMLAMAAVALSGCNRGNNANNLTTAAGGDHPGSLVGRWASERRIGVCNGRPDFDFQASGAAAFEGEAGTWAVEGDRLVLSRSEDGMETTVKIRFRQEGDRINLLGGPRESLLRCGSPAAQEAERTGVGLPMNGSGMMMDNSADAMDPAANAAAPMPPMSAH